MSGLTGLPSASSLLAAQAASFSKGQEASSTNGTERQDKARQRNQRIVLEHQVEKQQKTEDAPRGFLA